MAPGMGQHRLRDEATLPTEPMERAVPKALSELLELFFVVLVLFFKNEFYYNK